MRHVFRIGFALALGPALMAGCSDENGEGGSGGTAGTGGTGGNEVACQDNLCPCTEAGIRAAIAEGGGPFYFDCDGFATVVTEAEIVIDSDVILDGQRNLTVDGNFGHSLFFILGAKVELRGFTVTKAGGGADYAIAIGDDSDLTLSYTTVTTNRGEFWAIVLSGSLTVTNSTIVNNEGDAISGGGRLEVTDSTIAGNEGRGIRFGGTMEVTDSTIVNNEGADILGGDNGRLEVTNSTVGDIRMGDFSRSVVVNSTIVGDASFPELSVSTSATLTNTLIQGQCTDKVTSDGYNIESPGDTCGFDQPTDQVNVSADDLKLGPLHDNGGPTETHALGEGSVAIDVIPEVDCVNAEGEPLTTDQRGEPRDSMCDVGAFELSARDVALASYCAAVLECFPDDESCETEFANLWVGSGGDLAACTSAKSELLECVASLDCDKLAEEWFRIITEECIDQLGTVYSACEIPVK